jgi:glycosyltransferase involved in cell wall biosynthesis
VLTVGLRLPIASDRYEHITEVPFPHLLKVIGRIDIGIAPLADIRFNRFRSDVKLKEYASGAAAWLASPVGPYRTLGDREGGVLVGDDEWFAALDELIRSPRRRKQLAKRALKWAKRQTLDRHAESWEKAFLATVARAQAKA